MKPDTYARLRENVTAPSPLVSRIRLVNVYSVPRHYAAQTLYRLLAERPAANRISHEAMPTRFQHERFIACKPFRLWYLLEHDERVVGALECTRLNEVGIAIFREHQGKGHATEALKLFMAKHKPLRPIPAVRNGRWLANIATGNEGSRAFFAKMGFEPLQVTFALRREA